MTARRGAALAGRAAWVPVSVLLAGGLTWVATTLLPGDAATRILGANATEERLADLRARLGLDQPIHTQLGDWLGRTLRGDLGTSALTGHPVADLLWPRLANSLVLAGLAALLALICGVVLGVLAGRARAHRSRADAALIAASAIPDFVIGSLLVGVLAVSWQVLPSLSLIPAGQNPLARPQALVIPVLAAAVPVTAWIARYTSAALARHSRSAHVQAARRQGLPEHRVLVRHLLPGALAPLVQLFGWMCAVLIGSMVVVERVVAYPGIGSLLAAAVGDRDIPLVTAIVTVLAALIAATMFACDLLAPHLDRRLRTS